MDVQNPILSAYSEGQKKLENGSKNRFLTGYVIEGKANR